MKAIECNLIIRITDESGNELVQERGHWERRVILNLRTSFQRSGRSFCRNTPGVHCSWAVLTYTYFNSSSQHVQNIAIEIAIILVAHYRLPVGTIWIYAELYLDDWIITMKQPNVRCFDSCITQSEQVSRTVPNISKVYYN